MSEKRVEVRVFRVTLHCDECGGEMRPTGMCYTSMPPQYPHKCVKCGATAAVRGQMYPRIEHEEILK